MYNFYKPQYNPTNLTGQVGGTITSVELSGYLGELFYHVSAPPSGTTEFNQYRKVFVKNEYLVSSTDTKVWIDAIDHNDQISIAFEGSLNDTTSTPTGAPAGISEWSTPFNYSEGIEIGTLAVNASTGIWLKQTLTGIVEEDPFATFRLYVGGIIAS